MNMATWSAPTPTAEALGRVHFVGIGGAGMSGIARILLGRGAPVSGSDAKESAVLLALRALGARVSVGHSADNLADVDTVVVSTAIRPNNPELVAARERGLLVVPRAVALAAVLAGRRSVAVAGTHGKTSTTSMLTVALLNCGVDPSFAIGGHLNESGSNAHHGSGDLFIAEADESDGSFLLLAPSAAIVTNIEADHLDNWTDLPAITSGFERFVATIRPGGFLVLCADDPGARSLLGAAQECGVRVRRYGRGDDADLQLTDLKHDAGGTGGIIYQATLDGTALGRVQLHAPGEHMALNSAAALLAGIELGLPAQAMIDGLGAYAGVHRRFEHLGTVGGVRVYDDYAHHPTEITAQLRAARSVAGDGRLIVAFQPHLFSRTRAFAHEFGAALGAADAVVVMAIFGSREDPIPGVSGSMVASHIPLPAEQVHFQPSWLQVAPLLASLARPGDLVLTLGAGDIAMIGREVLTSLAGQDESAGGMSLMDQRR
ncbi:MAG: UDP-N-acetylmuramate--L-alanine ligase [Actinomycetota bacterium]|nr:UDP-N-acetylmuramate--L-alanine ligase [Actinomycetota bacterium]